MANDDTVDRYIIRDVDSRLNIRERFAVEEWINSDKQFHLMRDHPQQAAVIMGKVVSVLTYIVIYSQLCI